MADCLVRSYNNACFILNRDSHSALFFEGTLAKWAPLLLKNPRLRLPETEMKAFEKESREGAIQDFHAMKTAIRHLLGGRATNQEPAPQFNNLSANRALAQYAIKHWNITTTSLELTNHCNLRCKTCYLEDHDKTGLHKEEYLNIARQLIGVGVIFILFTGGEVFTRPDIMELMEGYDEFGFMLELKTNGILLRQDQIEQLSQLHLLNVQVSLYEVPGYWTSITQSNYNFKRVSKNLESMIELEIPVSVAVLVGQHNIDHLEHFHISLSKLGVKEIFYSPYITPNRMIVGEEIKYRLSYENLKEKFLPFLREVNALTPPEKYRCSGNANQPACYAGRDQIAIGTDGEVYPCLDLRQSWGNLQSTPLVTILKNRKRILKPYRLQEIERCRACNIRDYCDSCIGVAIQENGDFRIPSQHKCDVNRFYYTYGKEGYHDAHVSSA